MGAVGSAVQLADHPAKLLRRLPDKLFKGGELASFLS
jgi:hypothetical protein